MKKRMLKIYFWGGLIYQLIAIISLFSIFGNSPFYGYIDVDWAFLGLFITYPISIFSFGLMYAEKDMELYVILVQFCIFLIFRFIYIFLKKRCND